MRITLELTPEKESYLNYNYNYQTYSFITSLCNKKHDEKTVGKFSFQMYLPEGNVCHYKGKCDAVIKNSIYLNISSYDDDFIMQIANNVKLNLQYKILNFEFKITKAEIHKPTYNNNKYIIEALSPILVFNPVDNKKCISMFDNGYVEGLINNIKKKIGVDSNVDVKLLTNEYGYKKRFSRIKEKGVVTGYMYRFELTLDSSEKMYRLIESGFGGKNSLGFGFVKVID